MDYSQKEQKHPITKTVLAPMKAVKKMLVSMKLHLDASIDKLDNLAMNVQFDKDNKFLENNNYTKEEVLSGFKQLLMKSGYSDLLYLLK